MLNLELVDALYAGLPKAKQQELISLLFKRSKQTMNYFHRTKDISLSKFEILSDFFHISMDKLRVGGCTNNLNIYFDNNPVFSNKESQDIFQRNLILENEIAILKETIKAKDEALLAKSELIDALKKRL